MRVFISLASCYLMGDMKTIDEVRRLNLLIANKRAGNASELAKLIGTDAAYLSQIKNRSPDSKTKTPKTMGDDVARRIEGAIKEQPGWMDTPHPEEWDLLPQSKQEKGKSTQKARGSASDLTGGMQVVASNEKLSELLNLTCETLDEHRLLIAYRLALDTEKDGLDGAVARIYGRLATASRNELKH